MIGDVVAKAVLEYKADTADVRKKLKELQGDERKLAEEQLKATEQKNKALEGHIATIGRVAGTLAAAGIVAKGVWDHYKHEAEKSRLATASLGIEIERLNKA